MDPRESFTIAARSIRSHKLRSTLTVLGVVIGIASVVTFATFGASVESEIVGGIADSGANNVYVLGQPAEEEGFEQALQPIFTEYDLRQLAGLPGVEAVIPRGSIPANSVTHGGDTVSIQGATATTPAAVTNETLVAGRSFRSGANETVLNRAAAETTFEGNLSVGDEITVRGSDETWNLTVVGVVNGTAGELPIGNFGPQPQFYLPADPYYQAVVESPGANARQRAYPQVTVVADPAETLAVTESVETYLQEQSDARQLAPQGVELVARTSGDFAEQISDVIEQITRFVTGIAVIALVVGAIGIANIMLVSVTERTREIGIMKAVGARNRDVMELFLLEATLLGAVGAFLGLPLGLVVGWAATRYAEVGFAFAPFWSALAVLVGVLVGVVAGLYPAWRAARVDPIDALRYE
ncbi:ABC transporter permease [Halobellus litoreus]|uniref:ABC transporter permease n=1 Tax=Halobellus litoreus TaxID=755310 RepID=A0ABD6DRP3_9EURY|nr:ABC transporter permease [Halobellus litoreus]